MVTDAAYCKKMKESRGSCGFEHREFLSARFLTCARFGRFLFAAGLKNVGTTLSLDLEKRQIIGHGFPEADYNAEMAFALGCVARDAGSESVMPLHSRV
jgi:hypothetical protein